MITEKYQFSMSTRKGRTTSKAKRLVVITGSDLRKFADVLIANAAKARAEGNERNARRLERMAAEVRSSREFTCALPLDAKIT